MSGGAFMWSEALKIILPVCLDEITGWLRLFQSTERLRRRLFTFTFSCSGPTGLSAGTCSPCWAGGIQVGVSVWGLCRNGIHQFLFSLKWPDCLWRAPVGVQVSCLSGELLEWHAARRSDPLPVILSVGWGGGLTHLVAPFSGRPGLNSFLTEGSPWVKGQSLSWNPFLFGLTNRKSTAFLCGCSLVHHPISCPVLGAHK